MQAWLEQKSPVGGVGTTTSVADGAGGGLAPESFVADDWVDELGSDSLIEIDARVSANNRRHSTNVFAGA
jgi:hypothetical protein